MSYIEREALREELRHCCIVAFDERSGEPYVIDIPQLLRRTTVSADVAPVVHGEWIEAKLNGMSLYPDGQKMCSVCGQIMPSRWEAMPPFCYGCGAKMDKEAENERND